MYKRQLSKLSAREDEKKKKKKKKNERRRRRRTPRTSSAVRKVRVHLPLQRVRGELRPGRAEEFALLASRFFFFSTTTSAKNTRECVFVFLVRELQLDVIAAGTRRERLRGGGE